MEIIKQELIEVKEKYGDARVPKLFMLLRNSILKIFIPTKEMIITISHLGYIKRTPLSDFRAQNRGVWVLKEALSRDEDFIEHIYQLLCTIP